MPHAPLLRPASAAAARPRTSAALLRLGLIALLCASAAACARRQVLFGLDNARAHVNMLADTIGSRPLGSAANAKARTYLIDQLRLYGFDVRVQEGDASIAADGVTGRVANIIAIKPGTKSDAIGLVAHYDSVAFGPGAGDDGLGVAVNVEAARVWASQARTHSLIVVLTDGEENGLLGAALAVTDQDVRGRVKAYLNVEAAGSAGAPMLFESGPDAAPLLQAWTRTPQPRGASFFLEIYRRLPNDTDFSIVKTLNVPGLNFAAVGDNWAYHTSRDTAERLQQDTLRQTGETVVSILETLDQRDLSARIEGDRHYFDIVGRTAVEYRPLWGRVLSIVGVLLGLMTWLRALRATSQEAGLLRLLFTFVWGVLSIAAAVGGMWGATYLLRASREVFHPWYAHPERFLALLVAVGITVPWLLVRLMRVLPLAVQAVRTPAAIWMLALPLWIAVTVALEVAAPRAAFIGSLPLLACGLLLAAAPLAAHGVVRVLSVLVAAVCVVLWLPNAWLLFPFLVQLFGRIPAVTPSWLYAAFLTFTGLFLVAPIVAATVDGIRGRVAHALAGSILLLALAASIGLAYYADAYTADRPMRRQIRYYHDGPAQQAYWEVAGTEPGLDLGADAPNAGQWQHGAAVAQVTSLVLTPPQPPFVFHTGGVAAPAPADVAARYTIQGDRLDLDVTVVPKEEGVTARFYLPAGLTPRETNLPAAEDPRSKRLRATYFAVPSTGVAFRAQFPASDAPRLHELVVAISTPRLPGSTAPQTTPPWAPAARTAWQSNAVWILRPTVEGPRPPEPAFRPGLPLR